eukprot:1158963-Pelagomonas_calceolata.AAC.7
MDGAYQGGMPGAENSFQVGGCARNTPSVCVHKRAQAVLLTVQAKEALHVPACSPRIARKQAGLMAGGGEAVGAGDNGMGAGGAAPPLDHMPHQTDQVRHVPPH